MRETGRTFEDVLAEAQALGYAEADPGFDVDGLDTAHKLTILTGPAFGRTVDFAAVYVEGNRHISSSSIAYATGPGYPIKQIVRAPVWTTVYHPPIACRLLHEHNTNYIMRMSH